MHWPTVVVGAVTVAVTLAVRRLGLIWPAYLAGMAAAVAVVAVWDLAEFGVGVIGEIPTGLPAVGWPGVGWSDVVMLLGPAAAVALLMYTDSLLTEQSLAKQNDYDIDTNQEFLALGASNIGASLVGGFPANGSQSRSYVNAVAGAHSQVSNLVAGVLVVLTLLFLTPMFESLPRAALAGVLVVAALGFIDLPELRRVRVLNPADFWPAALTAALVVVVGVLRGVIVAVVLSLLVAALTSYRAHSTVLARVPGTDRYRDVESVSDPRLVPGLIVYRFDAPLFFANADQFQSDIRDLVEAANRPVNEVMDSAEAVVSVDSTGHETLADLVEDLHARGIRFTVARANPELARVLRRSGLYEEIDAFYLEVDEGVETFVSRDPPPGTGEM